MCAIPEQTTSAASDPGLYNVGPIAYWRNKQSTIHDVFGYHPQQTHWLAKQSEDEIRESVARQSTSAILWATLPCPT